MTAVVGIDLGGTNIRLAAWPDATALASQPVPAPAATRREEVGSERAPEALVDRLAGLIDGVLDEAGIDSTGVPVGVGIAAMLRGTDGTVANSPHLGWRDVPFGALLRERLGGQRHVRVANDVDAITYGEWRAGAGMGTNDILGVFVGTGIGAGIIAAGRLLSGAFGCAAELGHVKVTTGDDARPCACGLRGCVEAYVGGAYLQRRARAELAGGAHSLAERLAGSVDAVTPGHLDAAALEGDDYALDLYAEVAPLLGVVLANAVTVLDPARLILGGGMLSRTPVLRAHVMAAFDIAVNPPAAAELEVLDAALGDDAGLVGSALLAAN